MRHSYTDKQAGFVSIYSTIFFMLLATVITVGFLRIMALEQRQALDNDLSSSARASAESGIEDGKRALLKYYDTLPGDLIHDKLGAAFASNSCDAIHGDADLRAALGLSATGNVVNNEQFNQSYTCLKVALRTTDYTSRSTAGKSVIVPLKSAGGYTQVLFSWHVLSNVVDDVSDGPVGNYAVGPFPLYQRSNSSAASDSWQEKGFPAYMRVQYFGYPSGNFSRDTLQSRTWSALLVPKLGPIPTLDLGVVDPNHGASFDNGEVVPQNAGCIPASGNDGAYACSAILRVPNNGRDGTNFLRVTPIYGSAHFRVALQQDDGTAVDLLNAQPVIDSTGRAADVYRRLQARVELNAQGDFPEYVVESATDICKVLEISDDRNDAVNGCD